MKKRIRGLLLFSLFLISCDVPKEINLNDCQGQECADLKITEEPENPSLEEPRRLDGFPNETLKTICQQEEWPPDCGLIPLPEGAEMCERCKSLFPGAASEPYHGSQKSSEIPSSSGIPSCGDKNDFFTVSHIPISDLQNIVPLGNLNPPGHTFPTNHVYFHLKGFTGVDSVSSAPAVAPGDILVTRIRSSEYAMKGKAIKDYKLDFTVCEEVKGYFIHLTSLSDKLLQNFGEPSDCEEYDTGGTHYRNCEKDLLSPIFVKAGEPIGTVGGSSDFGLADLRTPELTYANPERWYEEPLHRVCPLDYFASDVKARLKSLLGSYDDKRTMEPICGEVAQDMPGAAQGVWFVKGTSYTYPEDPHISLVHDNVDPSKRVFSVGNSMKLPSGTYYFTPKSSGLVNRDFKDVRADGNIYCYETEGRFSKSPFTILIKLPTPATLTVEKKDSYSCGNGPWSFSSYAEFER